MAGNLVKTVPPAGVKPDFRKVYTDQVEIDKAAKTLNTRPHTLVTQYRYNSLNQVVTQNSPDANTSKFWYDKLGRLVVSQNAQQESDGKYSYTIYDNLGRITEVGQKPQSTAMSQIISQNQQDADALQDWLDGPGVREQITYTGYDVAFGISAAAPNGAYYGEGLDQHNMRNRVSYVYTKNLETDGAQFPFFYTGTFYTYDIHGNVETVLQDYGGVSEMQGTSNSQKRIEYDYDLISGKVNIVSYQPDWYSAGQQELIRNEDKFFHKYKYDAQNRLTEVYTSRDKIVWERDAAYQYYKHGPLARTEYGQLRAQGLDYAYTIQGWLKGVNSTAISATSAACPEGSVLGAVFNVTGREQYSQPPVYIASQEINFEPGFESYSNDQFETEIMPGGTVCTPGQGTENIPYTSGDMGRDGDPTDNINDKVARDAFGFSLNYFNNDYSAIGTGIQSFATGLRNLPLNNDGMITGAELFNGNIASMLVSIPKLGIAGDGNSGTNPVLYGYRYDQLNRIVGMNAYKNDPSNTQSNIFLPKVMDDYRERISYDPNGNILTYLRNGTTAQPKPGTGTGGKDMDDLKYKYLYIKPDNTKGEYVPGLTVLDPSWRRTNQLASVQDEVDNITGGKDNYKNDIDGQDAFNYEYDKIGNLIKDQQEGILNISWSVYGKIMSITKDEDRNEATTNDQTLIAYTYDAAGNRITKTVDPPQGATKTTIYVRDGSGNVMSVYEKETAGAIKQSEIHLYGSSRIGMVTERPKKPKPQSIAAGFGTAFLSTFTRNEKIFELSNHLGNVLVTITDKKKAVDTYADGDIDYYEADVISANDYYPGGMMMPGRKFAAGSGYRYGFNGQEKSTEIEPNGNSYTAEFWQYDARIGRRWNVDPKPTKGISPYSSFINNPNLFKDPFGDTTKFYGNDGSFLYQNNKGKGMDLYVVATEQFNSLSSKYKNKNTLTSELIKTGIRAYDNQDDAAASWAPGGFAATKGDNMERGARIFRTKAFGDKSVSQLFTVGSTVKGQKSDQPGVSQEIDPSGSTATLNGKDLTSYKSTRTVVTRRGNVIVSQKEITYQNWQVTAEVHTHPPGNDNFSISAGDIFRGQTFGGDYGRAVDGVSVYLVSTTWAGVSRMFRLDLTPEDGQNYFRSVREGETFMLLNRQTMYIKDGKVESVYFHGEKVR